MLIDKTGDISMDKKKTKYGNYIKSNTDCKTSYGAHFITTKKNKPWRALRNFNGRNVISGYYDTKMEASRSSDKLVRDYWSENGKTNHKLNFPSLSTNHKEQSSESEVGHGVHFDEDDKKWRVQREFDGELVFGSRFEDKSEALLESDHLVREFRLKNPEKKCTQKLNFPHKAEEKSESAEIYIKTHHGTFFAIGENGAIICREHNKISSSDCFSILTLKKNIIAIKSKNGKYLSADPNSSELRLCRKNISRWETFKKYKQTKGRVRFKTSMDTYLSAQPEGEIQLDREIARSWEAFLLMTKEEFSLLTAKFETPLQDVKTTKKKTRKRAHPRKNKNETKRKKIQSKKEVKTKRKSKEEKKKRGPHPKKHKRQRHVCCVQTQSTRGRGHNLAWRTAR